MGVLSIFSKKDNSLHLELAKVKEMMRLQHEWINFLHDNTQKLNSDSNTLKDNHIAHKTETAEQIKNIEKWIAYLHRNHKELSLELETIEKNLKSLVREEMQKYHSEIINYLEDTIVSQEIPDTKPIKVIEEKPQNIEKKKITIPEKELVNFLFNENKPLTYEDIATKTQKSINTIRVYMNSLKNKHDLIDEFKKPNGSKVFSLKNKEIVRTIYNF